MTIITKRGGETIVSETALIRLSPLATALIRAISFRATSYLDEVGLILRPQELEAIFQSVGHEYVIEKESTGGEAAVTATPPASHMARALAQAITCQLTAYLDTAGIRLTQDETNPIYTCIYEAIVQHHKENQ